MRPLAVISQTNNTVLTALSNTIAIVLVVLVGTIISMTIKPLFKQSLMSENDEEFLS